MPIDQPPSILSLSSQLPSDSIQIATWNCRGLHNSIPYIQHMISMGVDILVLQEHWLWPFEMSEFDSIDPNYSYTAVSDSCLSPTSTLICGCGGCAILWKKSIPAAVISNLISDRICGIQVPIEGTCSLSILGVYMPSSDQPSHVYNECIAVIDQAISNTCSSPLLIVSELNCHLGHAGCPRSLGMQWKNILDSHSLYVPSLSQLATGHLLLGLTFNNPGLHYWKLHHINSHGLLQSRGRTPAQHLRPSPHHL